MGECKICKELTVRQDITEALSQYCFYYDSGEFDRLREIFHPEAVIDFGERFCGTIDDFTSWAKMKRGGGNRYSHHVANVVINEAEALNERVSICAVSALVKTSEPNRNARLVRGFYQDKWLWSQGRWMIGKRIFSASISTEL